MVELKNRELRYRECIFGPHRDDIEFLSLDGVNVRVRFIDLFKIREFVFENLIEEKNVVKYG